MLCLIDRCMLLAADCLPKLPGTSEASRSCCQSLLHSTCRYKFVCASNPRTIKMAALEMLYWHPSSHLQHDHDISDWVQDIHPASASYCCNCQIMLQFIDYSSPACFEHTHSMQHIFTRPPRRTSGNLTSASSKVAPASAAEI